MLRAPSQWPETNQSGDKRSDTRIKDQRRLIRAARARRNRIRTRIAKLEADTHRGAKKRTREGQLEQLMREGTGLAQVPQNQRRTHAEEPEKWPDKDSRSNSRVEELDREICSGAVKFAQHREICAGSAKSVPVRTLKGRFEPKEMISNSMCGSHASAPAARVAHTFWRRAPESKGGHAMRLRLYLEWWWD